MKRPLSDAPKSSKELVQDFLSSPDLLLEHWCAKFDEEGYKFTEDLIQAEAAELKELTAELKVPERRRLLKHLDKLRESNKRAKQ